MCVRACVHVVKMKVLTESIIDLHHQSFLKFVNQIKIGVGCVSTSLSFIRSKCFC